MDYENDLRPTKVALGTVPSFVFDPYNPKNKEITQDQVQTLLRQYGVDVPITNLQLYRRAFVHVSYVHKPQQNIVVADKPDDCLRLYSKSNERLEFLGDGILEAVVKFYMYRRFPRASEGFMTDKKIAVVKNESIGRIALALGLDQFYILSRYAESKQTRSKLEKLGCLFEAFVGALFLDFTHQPPCTSCGLAKRKRTTEGTLQKEEKEEKEEQEDDVWDHTGPGFQVAQRFLENVLERHVDWVQLIARDDNFKNILQVILQKEFKVTPHYLELPAPNPNQYHMGVFLCLGQAIHQTSLKTSLRLSSFGSFQAMHDHMATHGKLFVFLGEGLHAKKKKAEQIACENALEVLYRHVLRSIVYKELGLPVDVVHDDATKTSQIVVMLNNNNNNNNNKGEDKRKMTSSITFQQLRDVTESLCLVLGEGYHPNDVHRATHLAYEEAFFLLKQYE